MESFSFKFEANRGVFEFMMIKISKKYVVLPISNLSTKKQLCFYETSGEGKLIMDFECKIDPLLPQYKVYVDMERYIGSEFLYDTIPHVDFEIEQSDTKDLPNLYGEDYRPLIHFTPEIGWLNDPNGMIKYHGTYHMFFQYNPCGTEWGNMHWGHAISDDMIHWKEQDIALFPDETGAMYSGSAIEDTHNVTGLQSGDQPPMLLFYTAAGDRGLIANGKKRTQCLAYSNDGGKSFKKYAYNPVIDHVVSYNRDPKIVWVEEIKKYLIALFLYEEVFGLFVSDNMLDWTLLQEVQIADEAECPDVYNFKVDGESYWVVIGASDKYVVGKFEKGEFVPKTKEMNLSHSPVSYAAQSFSGIDDGRVIRMAWQRLKMPCVRATQQMSIPMELKLKKDDTDCYLTTYPVEELKKLYVDTKVMSDQLVQKNMAIPLDTCAYDIHLVTEYGSDMDLTLFGHVIRIRTRDNLICFDKVKMPISVDRKSVDIRIVADRCSFEVFADNGRFYATLYAVCDYNLPCFRISSKDEINLKYLSYSKLSSIHANMKQGKD